MLFYARSVIGIWKLFVYIKHNSSNNWAQWLLFWFLEKDELSKWFFDDFCNSILFYILCPYGMICECTLELFCLNLCEIWFTNGNYFDKINSLIPICKETKTIWRWMMHFWVCIFLIPSKIHFIQSTKELFSKSSWLRNKFIRSDGNHWRVYFAPAFSCIYYVLV